ncbi:hypothetical protein Ciccas_002843, partial [Cichlidogyrus casuarinus]
MIILPTGHISQMNRPVADAPTDRLVPQIPDMSSLPQASHSKPRPINLLYLVSGQTTRVKCSSQESTPPVQLAWFMNDKHLRSESWNISTELISAIDGLLTPVSFISWTRNRTESELEFVAIPEYHGKKFECRVQNADDFGTANLPIVSTFLQLMNVNSVQIDHSRGFSLVAGHKEEFYCSAKSYPEPRGDFLYLKPELPEIPYNEAFITRDKSHEPVSSHKLTLLASADLQGLQLTCYVGSISPDATTSPKLHQMAWNKTSQLLHVE